MQICHWCKTRGYYIEPPRISGDPWYKTRCEDCHGEGWIGIPRPEPERTLQDMESDAIREAERLMDAAEKEKVQ